MPPHLRMVCHADQLITHLLHTPQMAHVTGSDSHDSIARLVPPVPFSSLLGGEPPNPPSCSGMQVLQHTQGPLAPVYVCDVIANIITIFVYDA